MKIRRIDPEHVYLDDEDHEWPGVTRILGGDDPYGKGRQKWEGVPPWSTRFLHVPPDRLEYRRQLGTAAHAAIALDVAGELDPETVDPAVLPYLEGWRRYRRESGFVPRETEVVVWHEVYHYAGTFDHLGTIGPAWYLIDTKTGSDQDADLAGPQTAAYLEAAHAAMSVPHTVKRASVHLKDDGIYRVVPHTSRRDWNVFLAALELFNFTKGRK